MKGRLKNIMVIVDYSEAGMNATRTAVEMCKRHNARLHLVHVHNTDYLLPVAGMQAPVLNLCQEAVFSEIDNLRNYAASIERNYGVEAVPHHELGSTYDVINRMTGQLSSDILVVANHKGTILQHSTGFQALKASTCPVLVLQGKKIDRFRNIVFPVRRIPQALDKLRIAFSLARHNRANIHVIGAIDKRDRIGFHGVREMVGIASRRFALANIPCDYEINAAADIETTVIDACSRRSADLVVITASTTWKIRHILSGNYAQRIIGNGEIPVLCVKPAIKTHSGNGNFSFAHSMLG